MIKLAGPALLLLAITPAFAQRGDDVIVGRINGQAITRQELDAQLGTTLFQLRQQQYDAESAALKRYAIWKLQEIEAKKRGISVSELRKIEIEQKSAKPTPEEIDNTVKLNQGRLPSDPTEARARVVTALTIQKQSEREAAYSEELLRSAKLEILLAPPRIEVAIDSDDPVRGARRSGVTLVEFSDFQCPYCGRSQETIKQLLAKYGDRVKFVFKNRPLEMHNHARFAAEAGMCAAEQGKFWQLHDWMFANPNSLELAAVKTAASDAGIDAQRLESCINEKKYSPVVQKDIDEAVALGINSTPAFFINGRLIEGARPLSVFEEVLDQELAAKAKN